MGVSDSLYSGTKPISAFLFRKIFCVTLCMLGHSFSLKMLFLVFCYREISQRNWDAALFHIDSVGSKNIKVGYPKYFSDRDKFFTPTEVLICDLNKSSYRCIINFPKFSTVTIYSVENPWKINQDTFLR